MILPTGLSRPMGVLSFIFLFTRRRAICAYSRAQVTASHGFYLSLAPHVLDSSPIYLCGNFYYFTDSVPVVRGSGRNHPSWNACELRRLMGNVFLRDSWVALQDSPFPATRSRGESQTRIYRFYLTPALTARARACAVLPFLVAASYISDNRPAILEL